jgi:hypothetical protein
VSVPGTIWSKFVLVCALLAGTVQAEVRNIPLVVPFSPGGPTDQIWRSLEPHVNQELMVHKIKLVTEYRTGAGGLIAANHVATAPTTTLGIFSIALAVAPVINPAASRFQTQDLSLVAYVGNIDMVATSNRFKTHAEFRSQCQARSLSYGSSGIGSATHLFAVMLLEQSQCKPAVHVPYKGMSQAALDSRSGQLDFLIEFANSVSGTVLDIDLGAMPLENWHVIVANAGADAQDTVLIRRAFDAVKKNPVLVNDLQHRLNTKNLASVRDNIWLRNQFVSLARLVRSVDTAQK